jgi:DNA primase catalytic subunit
MVESAEGLGAGGFVMSVGGTMNQEIKKYYEDFRVQMELVKCLPYRELAFRDAEGAVFRNCCGYNSHLLRSSFSAFSFFRKDANLYHSVGRVGRTPWITYNPANREEGRAEWQAQFDDNLTHYDFVMDIDHEDIMQAYDIARRIKVDMDKFEVPYSINFSGSKGFHIRIRDEKMPPWSLDEKIARYAEMAKAYRVKLKVGEKTIDKIYDRRRLIRLPYSVDCKTGKVVLPLSDAQFECFDINDGFALSPMRWINLVGFRGMMERQGTFRGVEAWFEEMKA